MHKLFNEISVISKSYKYELSIALFVIVLWLLLFNEAIYSAAKVWWVSDIYSHGFFILPITGYLVWRKRYELSLQNPRPAYLALIPLLVFIFIYILGFAGYISLFQHAAIFTILPLTVWLIFGTRIVKTILFPLSFILFSIPFGEEFIPLLQRITADNSVWLLGIFDIPVYRNGLYIEIPNGRFVVAEACSGVRFSVGAAVFGAIFAYISYTSKIKQFVFFICALIIPIIANSVRVSMIILIGYFSDMKLATGVDHLVYGWVFFAMVIILLIAVGNIWADKHIADTEISIVNKDNGNQLNTALIIPLLITIGLYLAIYIWSNNIINNLHQNTSISKSYEVEINESSNESWMPQYKNASHVISNKYGVSNDKVIDYYSAYYANNTPEAEMISTDNRLYDPNNWTIRTAESISITLANNQRIEASLYSLVGSKQTYRYMLYWYEVGGFKTSNKVLVKIIQAFEVLLGHSGSGRIVIYSIKYTEDDRNVSKEHLFKFVRHNYEKDV